MSAVERAFGTTQWPLGPSAWWRRELACPACAVGDRTTDMVQVQVAGMLVDRCREHGIWLDAGELGRLLDVPRVSELDELYELFAPGGEASPALVAFHRGRAERRALLGREPAGAREPGVVSGSAASEVQQRATWRSDLREELAAAQRELAEAEQARDQLRVRLEEREAYVRELEARVADIEHRLAAV